MREELLEMANILIVDDEEANLRYLERVLQLAGAAQIATTTDSRQVIALYTTVAPDLVVLDLMMPHLDGFALMAQLRARIPQDCFLPILVVTADITEATKRRALAAGAHDFLTKPVDPVEAVLRMQNLLEIRFLHRELQNRIARDLHDGPMPDVGVLLLTIAQCRREIEQGAAPAALASLARLRSDLCAVVQARRGVARDLRPPILDLPGLPGGLGQLAASFERETGVSVTLESETAAETPPVLATLVFRLVQEALNNIREHAAARRVEIRLVQEGEQLYLTVHDDGCGFVLQDRRRDALLAGDVGLAGMYERTKRAGGQLTITSWPGAGTTIAIVLPLEQGPGAGG